MSRWFEGLIRRGGRVHHDQLSPRLWTQLRRELARREARRAAARAGARQARALLLTAIGLLVAAAALVVLRGGLR